MQAIYDWAQDLYQRTGINLVFIYEEYERARFIEGLQNTLWLSIICVVLSVIIGVVGGFFPAIRAARLPVAQALREL